MRRAAAVFTLGVLMPMTTDAGERAGRPSWATRSDAVATQGMAATSHPLATTVAVDVLKAGGSAVDAAIAANAVIGLTEPTGSGIGGDLFAIVWDAKQRRLHGLNASGRAPGSISIAKVKARGHDAIPPFGALSVSVPGCVDGWFELHGKFGRLPMKKVLEPAIRYAREGHAVTEVIAHHWARNVPVLIGFPGFREQFTLDGRAPRHGEVWKNPGLATTLEKIAKGGRDAFYKGDIARAAAAHVQEQGGFLAWEDFASHASEWVEPVASSYRGYELWELPPNTQGIAAQQILNLLEGYDLKAHGFGSPEHVHLFVEAKKLAFEDRAKYYADPAFAPAPVAALVSKAYAEARRTLIDPKRAARQVAAGTPALRQGDTIYLTTADADGNMVSLIQSNFRGMGSGMAPPGLGFILQDRGELFALDPAHANALAGGKRPFHTIIPAFVTKGGEPWLSFGLMGGDMQPQGHAQILMNLVDFGMGLQEAGDAPRIYHAGSSEPTGSTMEDGGTVYLEPGFPEKTLRELGRRGHRLGQTPSAAFGGYQAIRVERSADGRVYYGASESRKDGHAAGY